MQETFRSKLKGIGNSGFVRVPMHIIRRNKLEQNSELLVTIKLYADEYPKTETPIETNVEREGIQEV